MLDPFQVYRPVHSHLSSLSIPIGGGKPPSTRAATSSPIAAPHRSAEIWAIQLPGSLRIKHLYRAMDPFQVSRPVHSHLSSLSIPIGSGKPLRTRAATSSPIAASHRSAEIGTIQQFGALQIKGIYAAMDPFQAHRPVHSHLSSLSIPIGRKKQT